YVGDDSAAEAADLRLERIASVEHDDVVTTLGDECVQVRRRQATPATHDALGGHLDLVRHTEADQLGANLHAQPREVSPGPLGPLHVDVREGWVLARDLDVLLERLDRPAEGRVN